MRKMIVNCNVGYVGYAGMDAIYPLLVEDDATQAEIDAEAWDIALQHAEMYGYYPMPDDITNEEMEDYDCPYVNSIEGAAEDYVPQVHDAQYCGDLRAEFESMLR